MKAVRFSPALSPRRSFPARQPSVRARLPIIGEIARWALLAGLVSAVWVYGCTPPWTLPWFTGALFAVTGLWIIGLSVRRRAPATPWPLWTLAVFLLLEGWTVVLNAGYRYDRDSLQFFAVKPLLAAWLPGALDQQDAIPMMLRMSGLLGVLLFAADATQHAHWRKRLFWTLTLNGALWDLYGLAQRISSTPLLLWRPEDLRANLFSTYYYHAHAGAFSNLMLPFAFGAAVRGFRPNQTPGQQALGVAVLFLNLAGAVVIASKAAQIITLLLLIALVVAYRQELGLTTSRDGKRNWRALATLALAAGGSAVALVLASGRAQERWDAFLRSLGLDSPRLLADQACLHMLPDAGWWGIGPGNFAIDFPHYTNGMPLAIAGRWENAHQDYLQTAIEWGWAGAAGWTAVVLGALWLGGRFWRRQPARPRWAISTDQILHRSAFVALVGVLLHALVDFPLQMASIQLTVLTLVGLIWSRFYRVPRFDKHAAFIEVETKTATP